MTGRFIHLHVHSEFSLIDGITTIKSLVQAAEEATIPALAVTDQSRMCAQIKFYQAAQRAGIKPVCGCDLWLEYENNQHPARLILLCMDETGYRNLMKIVSLSFLHNQHHGKALCKYEWIAENNQGLIALSGAREGDIGRAILAGKQDEAAARLKHWQNIFTDRFYLELQRTNRSGEEHYIQEAIKLAAAYNCPVVATNEVVFMKKEDFNAHEARFCIGESYLLDDKKRPFLYSEEQYFKSEAEMIQLFKDIPQAIENSVEIAKRCNVHIPLGKYYLPDYPVPADQTLESFFRQCAQDGLEKRLQAQNDTDDQPLTVKYQPYYDRLNFELDIILQMGFPGYFLIVMDFIRWAKENDIPVGPGRGSGAGSLVAYSLNITDLDPLKYDLLFERFLNPERVSMPDFDIDFCMEKRDQVIDYVARVYGRDAVSQIITFGTMAAKAVVRDVGRVQGKPYLLADKLSKLIPGELGMTLEKAFDQEENLRLFLESDTDATEIWEMALKLEGITRNVGTHAGGVVIAPNQLIDFAPLSCEESGRGLVTQYDKNDVELAGLVKFDFLGLRTLTIIDWALKMVNAKKQLSGASLIDINAIDLADPTCYKLLKTGETTAVFQLESRGMKDLIKRLLPDCFEDIIALVALFRPGPLQSGMVDNFINRKHGRERVSYPDAQYQHELLQPVLEPTYGIILYQEQVMQIAQVMAGYTLGGADLLRRAMGKKKPEEMAKQRSIFAEGAKEQGIDPTLAMKIFDLVEKFAGYGFNKSHSAAYALLSYQTLWLKTYFPAEFMASVMSSEMQNTDKIVILSEECKSLGLTLLPPQINAGEFMFHVNDDGHIIYGLGALKGVGEGPVEAIVSARKTGGKFTDLFDFCQRVGVKKINKRCMEALIRSGALDETGPDITDLNVKRAVLFASMNDAIKAAEQTEQNLQLGTTDLFGMLTPVADTDAYVHYKKTTPWTDKERLNGEKETLGLYLTGHPIDEYANEIAQFISKKINQLQPAREVIRIAGLIVAIRIMRNKRGDKMGFLVLDDQSGRIEVAAFSDTFVKAQHKLVKDNLVVITGEVNHDEYSGTLKMSAREVMTLSEAREYYAKAVQLTLSSDMLDQHKTNQLAECIKNHPGKLPILVNYSNREASARLLFGKQYQLAPDDAAISALKDITSKDSVMLIY